MASIEVCSGEGARQSFNITADQIVLGRDAYCDVVVPVSSISRQHARIELSSDGYYLEDLGSLNGTFVNGQRISRKTRLNDLDRIHLYEVLLTWHENGEAADGAVEPFQTTLQLSPAADSHDGHASPHKPTIVDALEASDEFRVEIGAQAKLRAILEITRNLGNTLSVDEFLPDMLDSLFAVFPQSERGYILLLDKHSGNLTARAVKHRGGESEGSLTVGPISGSIARRVMEEGEAILSTDRSMADEQGESVLELPTCSRMTVPLKGPGRKPQGILHIDTNDAAHCFTPEDLEVLASVATIAAQAIEQAQMHELALRLDQRERELATAKEVQLHFLPQRQPEVAGYRFFDYYRAAADVGGDYFDYVPLADGRLAVGVGDVSGKGVSAALLMARLCSEVRFCLASSPTLDAAFERLNVELASHLSGDRFVTFLLCVIDPRQHTLSVLNAGHMPPLCRRASTGAVEPLGAHKAGVPLGFDPLVKYSTYVTELAPGDLVVMYTDGITEASNVLDDYYGARRLQRLIAGKTRPCEETCRTILADLDHFSIGVPQSDDICLLGFARD